MSAWKHGPEDPPRFVMCAGEKCAEQFDADDDDLFCPACREEDDRHRGWVSNLGEGLWGAAEHVRDTACFTVQRHAHGGYAVRGPSGETECGTIGMLLWQVTKDVRAAMGQPAAGATCPRCMEPADHLMLWGPAGMNKWVCSVCAGKLTVRP